MAQVTFTNYYKNKDTGSLQINKTVEGLAENRAFTFEITGPNSYSKQVTINADEFYENKGSYTINGLAPGTYTVTEQNADEEGYVCTTKVNSTLASTTTVCVKKNQKTTVNFVNTYSQEHFIDISGEKVWNVGTNDNLASVTVGLFAKDSADNFAPVDVNKDGTTGEGDYKVVNGGSKWQFTFEDVPQYASDNKTEIEYVVKEIDAHGNAKGNGEEISIGDLTLNYS